MPIPILKISIALIQLLCYSLNERLLHGRNRRDGGVYLGVRPYTVATALQIHNKMGCLWLVSYVSNGRRYSSYAGVLVSFSR